MSVGQAVVLPLMHSSFSPAEEPPQNELNEEDAELLVKHGCQLVVEGANMPCTAEVRAPPATRAPRTAPMPTRLPAQLACMLRFLT